MMGPLPSPHTSSHKVALDGATVDVSTIAPAPEAVHVAAPDLLSSAALTASAVVGVVAASRARRRLRPLSADGRARVEGGGSSLSERRRGFYTEPF